MRWRYTFRALPHSRVLSMLAAKPHPHTASAFMAIKSKFFRVGVEGVTTDGREISRDWIQQMAATYNRAKYGARIFAEHIRGAVPDGPFRALGDVLNVKAEEITEGDLKGKLALYAQIEPSEAMVKLVQSGQKIYSSMEVDSAFAGGKLAYLVGLGITDSPASLGTEILAFAAQHPDTSPFKSRKQRPENLFSAATETAIELEPEAPAADQEAGFFAKLNALLDKFTGTPKPAAPPATATPPAAADMLTFATELRDCLKGLAQSFGQMETGLSAMGKAFDTYRATTDTALAEFRTALDTTAAPHTQRPPATGGNGAVVTDC